MEKTKGFVATITEDPLKGLPVGHSIGIEPIAFGGSDATRVPQGVTNWTFFDGALCAVGIGTTENFSVLGTAVLIAPGLAVTAAHVVDGGTSGILCLGPTRSGADVWRVRTISMAEGSDIAYLSLQLASAISPEWRFRALRATTRTPREGESVSVVGFVFNVKQSSPGGPSLEGQLYAAAGKVSAVHFPMRDRLLLPFPCLEIECGSIGGMSGGAVLDQRGHLLGITSRGLSIEDGAGPSYAAWIVGGLNREVAVPWPPRVYPQPVHLLNIDQRLFQLEGRDKIRVSSSTSFTYETWF